MDRLPAYVVAFFTLTGCPLHVATTSYSHYRLPASIQPDSYHLKIVTHLDATENFTFDGQVSIRFQALEDTSNITLHAKNLAIDESLIRLKSYNDTDFCLCLEAIDMVPEQDYYIMHLCQSLIRGNIYKINLYFSGILNRHFRGYYLSSYVDEVTKETRWLSATQFEPAWARAAFPCLDEPIYKANFTIWLGHHISMTALSNMPLEKRIPFDEREDFVWSIFEESVAMSTYLVAYTINDFAHKESRVEGSDIVFRTWSRPDHIDQCDYASEVAPKLLKYYEGLFGIPFPLAKIDEIAIPQFKSGAMENWGLIMYRETVLLSAANVSSQLDKFNIAKAIAHELAHQWFGNLVTMKWWTDLWLNEGFATYVGSLGVHMLLPQHANSDSFLNNMIMFRRDVKSTSHPISQPIAGTSEIPRLFDSISYMKGSAVLGMVHAILGHDGFFEGVHDYLSKHKYKNAEQDDLWAAFTEKAWKFKRIEPRHDMKTIMDSWTLQTGYPVLKISRNYETGSIEITQQRFLESVNIPEDGASKCWWVPLSYTTAGELDFTITSPKLWLECSESGSVSLKLNHVAAAHEWIIFNIQLTGFYRVMYDTNNWRLITNSLHSDQYFNIHVMNRAQIIGDALSLAWGGYHGYDIAFDTLEYLTREREYVPWKSALNGLADVFNLIEFSQQIQPYFNAFLRYIIAPIYYYEGADNDTDETSWLLKPLLSEWACRVELDGCVDNAINYFQQWKLSKNPDDENNIPADLRGSVYCTALRHGKKDDWTFLWQRYKASHLDAEKITIIKSLACSRNKSVLRDYLIMMFDRESRISQREAMIGFAAISSNYIGAHIAREYYAANIDRLHYRINVSKLLEILAARIVSAEDFNLIENLIATNKEYFRGYEETVQYAFELIQFNLQWIEKNLQYLTEHLQSRLLYLGILEDQTIYYYKYVESVVDMLTNEDYVGY